MMLGEELRRLRKSHRLTLSDVSEKTGISVSFLSDIERNRTKPSLDTLEKLAECFQIPVNRLIVEGKTGLHDAEMVNPPGYQDMLDELGERIDPVLRDLLLQVEHRARRRPEKKEDWLQLYYSLKSALGR